MAVGSKNKPSMDNGYAESKAKDGEFCYCLQHI